jgi:uncharacterized protein involved in oxidation of intracellular sulfur
MKVLFILNDAPYGSEKTYNGLRLAMALQKDHPGAEVRIFLMADAVTAAIPAQNTPQGHYSIERMLKIVIAKGGQVKLCGSCREARGISMSQLALWTTESEKVLVIY